MERSVIDQSALITEVLWVYKEFELTGSAVAEMARTENYDLESYRWHLVDRVTGDEELACTWKGMAWVGVKAAR